MIAYSRFLAEIDDHYGRILLYNANINNIDFQHLSWLLCFIVVYMSCYCKCSVALPHGAVSRSAMCHVAFVDRTDFLVRMFFESHRSFVYEQQRKRLLNSPLRLYIGVCMCTDCNCVCPYYSYYYLGYFP